MSKFPIDGFSIEKLQAQFDDPRWGGASRYHALRDGGKRLHQGVDLYAVLGAPVYAIRPGKVTWIGLFYNGTWGVSIEVSPGVEYLYCEVQPGRIPIKFGQTVSEGQVIGYVGDTKVGMPPMLHFEYRVSGVNHDPMEILSKLDPRFYNDDKYKFKLFLKPDKTGFKVTAYFNDKPVKVESLEMTLRIEE